ncbi:O-antigen ligase family protein [Terasakiella sp. SH-1]|uniref:O-antigen ligase family protein n=1 Tax=Terasakiella sp. SH-1 TaxID=2560057 RepID=UPI00142FD2EA|nr:O-antigen ligase family protein [Terasakiella sp. SH-1]
MGLAVPAVASGRATLAIFLSLALLSVIYQTITTTKRIGFQRSFISEYFGLFTLCCLTCLLFTPNIIFSYDTGSSLETWIRHILLPIAIFFVCWHLQNCTFIQGKLLTIGILFVSTVGITAFYIEPNIYSLLKFTPVTFLQVYQGFKPPSNAFVLAIPLLIFFAFNYSGIWRLLSLCAVICIVSLIFIFDAKASMVALIAAALAPIALYIFSSTTWKINLIAIILITLAILGVGEWLVQKQYMTSVANQDLAYLPVWLIDFHRQTIWQFALELWQQSPWVGYGINASNLHPMATQTLINYYGPSYIPLADVPAQLLPGHPHNWVLEILLDTGVIGFVPFISLVCVIFWKNITEYWKTRHPALLVLFSINAAYWGSGLFNFSYWAAWWQASYYICAFTSLIIYLNVRKELS